MNSTYDIADNILGVVAAALEADGRACATKMVVAGDIALDDCCDGVLLVRPGRVFQAVDPFPSDPPLGFRGDRYIAIEIVVYLSRCIPVLEDDGSSPPQSVVDEKTKALLVDAATIWNLFDDRDGFGVDAYGDPLYEVAYIEQEPQPNQGMCAAVETRVTIGLPISEWCP